MKHPFPLFLTLLLIIGLIASAHWFRPVTAADCEPSIYLPIIQNPHTPPPGATPPPPSNIVCNSLTTTDTVTVTPTITPTPSSTATASVTPTITPTPGPTITPRIPPEVTALATAISPKGSYTAPNVQIASLLFQNKTANALLITVQSIPEPLLILPSGQTERLLAPGIYTYTASLQGSHWSDPPRPFTLTNHTRLTIPLINGTIAFKNETNVPFTITVPTTAINLRVKPGATSQSQSLPPNLYPFTLDYTSGNTQVTATGTFTVPLGVSQTLYFKFRNLSSTESINPSATVADKPPPIIEFTTD